MHDAGDAADAELCAPPTARSVCPGRVRRRHRRPATPGETQEGGGAFAERARPACCGFSVARSTVNDGRPRRSERFSLRCDDCVDAGPFQRLMDQIGFLVGAPPVQRLRPAGYVCRGRRSATRVSPLNSATMSSVTSAATCAQLGGAPAGLPVPGSAGCVPTKATRPGHPPIGAAGGAPGPAGP